jgi:hypothetical protein
VHGALRPIDIKGIDRAELLAALYNGTRPVGLGRLSAGALEPMTAKQARQELEDAERSIDGTHITFDYVRGRPIKVDFAGDTLLRPDLYDRDAGGPGTCERIVAELRAKAAP